MTAFPNPNTSNVSSDEIVRGRLLTRIDELLENNTSKVLELRATDRKRMVREFFMLAGQTIGERPLVPDDEIVRFRLRLIAEEFFELLVAAFGLTKEGADQDAKDKSVLAYESTMMLINRYRPDVDLPELIDASVDIDYVIEGLRVAFGVDSTPVWQEVHRTNMAKRGGSHREGDLKLLKPPGWVPPQIHTLLVAQGWTPPKDP